MKRKRQYKQLKGIVLAGIMIVLIFTVLVKAGEHTATTPKEPTTVRQEYMPFYVLDWELKTFLSYDTTDTHTWVEDSYTCEQFAEDLSNNAKAAGIQANKTILWYNENKTQGHVIVCFTRGNQKHFVEPQTDCFLFPEINQYYNGHRIINIEIQ